MFNIFTASRNEMSKTNAPSFDTLAAAADYIAATYDVIYGEEVDGAYDALVRYKNHKASLPFQLVAR